jgi:hypothetical protein
VHYSPSPSEEILARITFADSEEVIVEFRTDPTLPIRPIADREKDVRFASFGIPTQSGDGQNAFIARFHNDPETEVDASNDTGVFVANDLDTPTVFQMVLEGVPVPEIEGARFGRFQSVVNNGVGVYAFIGSMVGDGINEQNNSAIWLDRFQGLRVLAREGTEAPGAGGANFSTFTSLAMPVYGRPIFSARTFNPQTRLRSAGIWFTDDDNALRLVIREGDRLEGDNPARIRTLNILERVAGSPSQTRSFNSKGALIYRAALFGGRQAIVQSNIPGTWND